MTSEKMEAEFGAVAEWTAGVAAALGPEYHIPAACRGSGQPAALDWLLDGLRPGPGELLADVGAGAGGPSAYAARRTGARPVLAEPEAGACRAAARLFRLPVLRADATALPFASASAGLAWSLGVLSTVPDQLAMLRELRRVVRPGGRIGLLVYVAVTPELDDPPEGNHFPASGELHDLFRAAGLAVAAAADARDLRPPAGWQERADTVGRELRRRYGHTPELAAATGQSDRIGRLLGSGKLTSQVLLLQAG